MVIRAPRGRSLGRTVYARVYRGGPLAEYAVVIDGRMMFDTAKFEAFRGKPLGTIELAEAETWVAYLTATRRDRNRDLLNRRKREVLGRLPRISSRALKEAA